MEVQYPLVIFTLLTCLSVGATCIAIVAELVGITHKDTIFERIARWGSYLAAPAILIGLLASTLHLSKPLAFITGLSHVGPSWISNEGCAGLLFSMFIIVFAILHFFSNQKGTAWKSSRALVGLLAALSGLSLLYSQGMAYATVRPIPAWNTPLTLGFFVASSFALGVLALATVLAIGHKVTRDEGRKISFISALKVFIVLGTIAVVLQAAVAGMWLIHLKTGLVIQAAIESFNLLVGPLLVMTLLRGIIGTVLPLVLLGYGWMKVGIQPQSVIMLVIVSSVCVLIGEIIARQLFFMVVIHI
ncbi:MAG: DmsC/YnfH family molybdoenzyme membrane anchor subunit [Pseudomonadota bacterium]